MPVLADSVLHAGGLRFTWAAGHLLRFDRADRIAILFCGAKKV